jgi:hypothetical protein
MSNKGSLKIQIALMSYRRSYTCSLKIQIAQMSNKGSLKIQIAQMSNIGSLKILLLARCQIMVGTQR